MTPSATPPGVAGLAARALALSMGRQIAPLPPDEWDALFSLCARERLAVLAWTRSGDLIRASAPATVALAWRQFAVRACERSEQQVVTALAVVGTLRAAGVEPVLRKGFPLAVQLYGRPELRPTTDIDLFVAAPARGAARQALLLTGWRHLSGDAPWEESFESGVGPDRHIVELHSTALSDRLMHVARAEPDATPFEWDGDVVQCDRGPTQAVFLAVHLAKHNLAPLLWHLDFATLWENLSDDARHAAERAADRLRLGRSLAWARGRVALVHAAADGNRQALGALGFTASGRAEPHAIWRTLALAGSVADFLGILGDWIAPRARRGGTPIATLVWSRLRERARSLFGWRESYGRARS